MTKTEIKQKLIDIVSTYLLQASPNQPLPDMNTIEPLSDIIGIDSLMSVELTIDILDEFGINDTRIQSIFIDNSKLKYPRPLNINEIVDKISDYIN